MYILSVLFALLAVVPFTEPPPTPSITEWTFREELAKPVPLPRFSSLNKGGEYWVSNRISRCYFGPIKRPPLNHDELMDDVDYYPEPYLERLQREGVNGLWLTVEWRDLAETSFTRKNKDADRRIAKLIRTVDRCLKYGIKTWIFCIEPKGAFDDDVLYREHPELFSCVHGGRHVMCPLSKATQTYIEESVRDIFLKVPRLGGIMMIAHGERPTTCLSTVSSITGEFRGSCPRCSKVEPWQIHWETASAIMRGIRSAGSKAEYISWIYQPQVKPTRGAWVADLARHLPDGVTMAYNFESGAIKEQLGRFRNGGDYWLSYVGPAQGFKQVAEAGSQVGARIGAKIQVCNSHEVATVPFVPVPGLLYRKYKAMKSMGVSTVLQCWYFGNYPGLMNEAAGLLSREDFADDELSFLNRLAAPHWGPDASVLANVWKRYSDAYAEYPLSNDMQYYGPFHAGVAWPMLPDVWLLPLGRTWKPHDSPSGDAIGECLENHTIEEALILARRMSLGVEIKDELGRDVLDELAARWKGDKERILDIGVMKALACQFASGYDILEFYHERAKAIYESRVNGNHRAALKALKRMDAAVVREEAVTKRILPLAAADSRLGFHSEAECHQYHPAKLQWRLNELKRSRNRIAQIIEVVEKGDAYPLSPHELNMPSCVVNGAWVQTNTGIHFKVSEEDNGDFTFEARLDSPRQFEIATIDAVGVSWYRSVRVLADGRVIIPSLSNAVSPQHEIVSSSCSNDAKEIKFTLSSSAWGSRADRRPGWIQLIDGLEPLWPKLLHPDKDDWRLNLSPFRANLFGRLVYNKE